MLGYAGATVHSKLKLVVVDVAMNSFTSFFDTVESAKLY
jgi:hypothetical protein